MRLCRYGSSKLKGQAHCEDPARRGDTKHFSATMECVCYMLEIYQSTASIRLTVMLTVQVTMIFIVGVKNTHANYIFDNFMLY